MRTWKGPSIRGHWIDGPTGGIRSSLRAHYHRHGVGVLIAWWLSDIKHRIPQELPECVPALLVSPHRRNGLKLEMQDDFDQDISSRKPVAIPDVRRVGPGNAYRVPERFVCHTTTGHRASMVRQ